MSKLEFHWDTVVAEFKGAETLEALELHHQKTGERSTLPVTGAFVAIGMAPNTAFLQDLLSLDEWGFILTDPLMGTDIPGIYAAGDVRVKLERQISTAVGDGTIAAVAVERYLENLKHG